MTVETQTTKVFATLNGSATVFSFSPLVIFESSDLSVTLVGASGNQTVLTEGVGAANYSVSVSSYPGTGSITYPATGSAANNGSLVMKRVLVIQQTTDLENQGGYFADTQESALDRLTMTDLQQQEEIDRSLKFPVSDVSAAIDLPAAAERAGLGLVFDSQGNPIAGALSSTTVSSAMIPVAQAASLALGRTALGLGTAATAALAALAQLATANTFTGAQTLSSATAGAAVEKFLTLLRDHGAGAANDFLEALALDGKNSANAQKTFAQIYAQIVTATAGAEDGQMLWDTAVAGTLANRMKLWKGLQLGAPTGGDKGAGTVNAASGIYLNGASLTPKFNLEFVSAQQTITAAGALTLAHGLGVQPKLVTAKLHCLTAENGYSIGDEIVWPANNWYNGSQNNGLNVVPDATNLNVRYASGSPTFQVGHKTTGALATLTNANWTVILSAWA